MEFIKRLNVNKVSGVLSFVFVISLFFVGLVFAAGDLVDDAIVEKCSDGRRVAISYLCKQSITLGTDSSSILLAGVNSKRLFNCAGDQTNVLQEIKFRGDINVPSLSEDCRVVSDGYGPGQMGIGILHNINNTPPPVSFAYFINKEFNDNLLGTSVYAASPGGFVIDVVFSVWEYFRNLAYLAFVVIIIATGFMVMFRAQIDPRMVVTVQAAIPRFFLSLILITFSYGIGALLISGIYPLTDSIARIGGLGSLGGGGVIVMVLLSLGWIFASTGPIALGALIVALVIIALFIFGIFAILWQYVKRLIGLVILTVLAPIIILIGTIPGQGDIITHWFKGLLANLFAIPAMYLVYKISLMVMTTRSDDVTWFMVHAHLLQMIMAIAILFYSLKVPGMIDNFLGYTGGIFPAPDKRK